MAVIAALRHVAFENLGILEELFTNRGDEVHYFDAPTVNFNEPLLQSADLLVVLGAPIGAFDDELYPFIATEAACIKQRLDSKKSILGICLGAQLIARVLGADVKSMGVKEIGFSPLLFTEEGENSPLSHLKNIPVLHWHGDRFDLPPSAERLAYTGICSEQAFSIGNNVLGLQFHLEADTSKIEQWLVGHACELSSAKINLAQLRQDAAKYGSKLKPAALTVVGEWLNSFL